MITDVKKHYDNLSKIYDELWFYSDDFVDFITDYLITHLDFQLTDKVVDLGCGTGIYSKGILKKKDFEHPIHCVDLSTKMLAQLKDYPNTKIINSGADTFCEHYEETFDKIFAKEMLHHIEVEKRSFFYDALYRSLAKDGLASILQIPPILSHPLFQDAIDTFEKRQIHYDDIKKGMLAAGFSAVHIDFISYPLSIEKNRYLKMVANRYISILSLFSDDEIKTGIEEIEKKHKNHDYLEFDDIFVVVTGKK
jgi:SAM-dependent methyltransferase